MRIVPFSGFRPIALNLTPASAALTFTGERFTPENRGAIWYEHWHRYCALLPAMRGLRVLDAACGEGYGSALLAREAADVIGVDVGADAVAHARSRYAAHNLRFVRASVTALPFPSAFFDAIVSFETIEHLAEQRDMLAEFRRVLTPDGVLVISSPNRPVYNEAGAVENEFHVRELDRDELRTLLDHGFPHQAWYGQRVFAQSALWAEGRERGVVRFDALGSQGPSQQAAPAAPMYFVVVCGALGGTLPELPALSLFDDAALSLWREFARMSMRERQLAWDELDARKVAEDRLADLVVAVNAASSERARATSLTGHVTILTGRVAALEGELAAIHAGYRAALDTAQAELARTQADFARESSAHGETRSRLAYRESLPGWLRWPLGLARRRFAVRAQ